MDLFSLVELKHHARRDAHGGAPGRRRPSCLRLDSTQAGESDRHKGVRKYWITLVSRQDIAAAAERAALGGEGRGDGNDASTPTLELQHTRGRGAHVKKYIHLRGGGDE